jgi:hypothetical protein
MENVVKGFCRFEGCRVKPTFGTVSKKPLYCVKHKSDEMWNVLKPICEHNGCNLQPSFGYDWKQPIFCKNHKEHNMKNVVSTRCKHNDCDIQASFGYVWKTPVYCHAHKRDDMKNVCIHSCTIDNCATTASFGDTWMQPRRCNLHRLPTDKNVTHRACQNEFCDVIGNPKYHNYCLRCYIHMFPDEPRSRKYKIREGHMVDFIKRAFPDEELVVDKVVDGGCSRRRPDVYIDKLTHVVIVECDENQHNQRFYSCDNKRLMELFRDFGSRPLVMIRFNPDKYRDENEQLHPSCFSTHRGFDVPLVSDPTGLQLRFTELEKTIGTAMSVVPDREVTVHSLFYDKTP